MYRFFKFILGTGLVVTFLWSCSLDDAAPVLPINLADPIPLAKEFYTQEKPKQVISSFRIQTEQEIFPFWEGVKIHADGRILIVPAHRKVQVRYEAGYLRRFVFELDERGQVIRGGMLELAGKELEFLLHNEVLLVEGFLAGVKSKDLTYLWSDFVARPLDGMQADGRVVALQREGGAKYRLDAEALRTEFCIDWYWVYSRDGVVVFEVYSHTTCGSTSCDSARTADAQDACLDDGTGAGGDDFDEINMKNLKFCHQNIISQLIGSSKKDFKIIFDKFNGQQPVPNSYNVNFQYGVCNSSATAAACTDSEIFQNWITININETITSEATDIFMGLTVLHEMLHAYLKFELKHHHISCVLNCLMDDYLLKNGGPINQHALFTEVRFINNISLELKNFASARGYNVNQLGDRYFKDLAWAGLYKTEVFKSFSVSEQNRIKNTASAELSNLITVNITPKGTKACML